MLKSSYHYILSGLMVVLYGQIDRLMLKKMIGEQEVGYYTLAVQLCSMWVFILTAIIDSMYPTIMKLYNTNRKEFDAKNRTLYAVVFYLSMLAALMFQIFSKPAILFIYGNQYIETVTPLRILAWYTAFSYLGVARNAWLVCENKQKYLKYIYFFAAIINILLNYLMIPLWGAAGAALASLITQILTSIGLPLLIKQLRPNAFLMIEGILLKGLNIRKNSLGGN